MTEARLQPDRSSALPADVRPAGRLKRTVQRAMHGLGLHVGRYPPVDSLAHHLKHLFDQVGVNCVLDVGAHHGEYGRALRALGYGGVIVSFEPVRATYARLARECGTDPRWRAHNLALGAENADRAINVFSGSVFNSFRTVHAYGARRFRANIGIVGTERVRVARLDAVIDEAVAGIAHPRVFLKMDTQGWDLEVVKGAGDRLMDVGALQTELSVIPVYEGLPSFAESIAHFQASGFAPTGIFPVARDLDRLRAIEFDCVMLRTPGLSGSSARASD